MIQVLPQTNLLNFDKFIEWYPENSEDVYETMGIAEYWIVDYLVLGGRKFIGYPKQPTLTIYHLENGEYQSIQFRGNQLLKSNSFPELEITAEKVFRGE